MVFGQVMLGAIRTNGSPISVDETVPLARLLNEYEVIAVPADSHYRTLQELIQDFKTDRRGWSWAGVPRAAATISSSVSSRRLPA